MRRTRSKEAGFTLLELAIVLAVFVPVVVTLAGFAAQHQQHNRAQESHAAGLANEGRALRQLRYELRNAAHASLVDASLRLATNAGRTEWRLDGSQLSRVGKERFRLDGVRALRLQESARGLRVEIDRWRQPRLAFTVCPARSVLMAADRGCVHVWVLLIVVLIGGSANMAVGRMTRAAADRTQSRAATIGLYAAEAGIAKARVVLRADAPASKSTAAQVAGLESSQFDLEVDGVRVEVEVRELTRGRVAVRSTAIVMPRGKLGHPHRCTIAVELARGPGLPRVVKRSEARPRF